MEEGEAAVASFENPAGGEPIVVRAEDLAEARTRRRSKARRCSCVVKDRPYAVSIRIEGADGAVMQTIETTMTSSQDQSMLPDRPLVVGPVYTPNPDLAGHPDGKLPDAGEAGLPASRAPNGRSPAADARPLLRKIVRRCAWQRHFVALLSGRPDADCSFSQPSRFCLT